MLLIQHPDPTAQRYNTKICIHQNETSTKRSFLSSPEGSNFASLRALSAAHRTYAINFDIDLLFYKKYIQSTFQTRN
jgi:hypothetical protein